MIDIARFFGEALRGNVLKLIAQLHFANCKASVKVGPWCAGTCTQVVQVVK